MSFICGMMQLSHKSFGGSTPSELISLSLLGLEGCGIFDEEARLLGLLSAGFDAIGALGLGA
jgi:hypothetical protein